MSISYICRRRFWAAAFVFACVAALALLQLLPRAGCGEQVASSPQQTQQQDQQQLLQQLHHQPQQPASAAAGSAAASVSASSPASLLVIVIASDEPLYAAHRAVWRMMAAAGVRFGVKVYFTKMREGLDDVTVEGDTVVVPGVDCITPCMLLKTMATMNLLVGPGAAPHAYEYVMRTNLSSVWVWARLLAWIRDKLRPRGTPIRAGVIIGQTVWTSGAGTIMSIDAAHMLVEGNASLLYKEMDDVAMSEFLHAKNVPIEPMTRADFTSADPNPIGYLPTSPDSGAYHYRIKPEHDRARYDGYVMARLFADAYHGDGAETQIA